MQPSFDFNRLAELLSDVLSGDNQKIKQATSHLKKFTKTPECVEPLLTVISNSPNPQYRQLAAILLKRNGVKLYSELDQEKQTIFKNALIERYFAENVKIVRNSLGNLIGQIVIESEQILRLVEAKIEQAPSVEEKEKAIYLLGSIIEFSGGRLRDYFPNLLPFFQACLSESQSSPIRLATLKCFLHVIESSENLETKNSATFSPLFPTILSLLPSSLLSVHNSDLFVLSLDIFTDLAEMKSPVITPHLATIIEFILSPTVIFNKELPLNVKETGLDFILVVSEQNRKVLSKNPSLLNKVIKDVVGLCALPFKKEEEEDSLQDVALWLIESLSLSLPNKTFYPVIMTEIGVLLQNVNDENKLNTAYLILAAITKGCQSKIRKALPDIMKNVMPLGLTHASPKVRGAGIAALAYLSEHLIPEIIEYHQDIVPFLLGALGDIDKKVVEKALFAINIFCENMEGEINTYLDKIMPALAVILTSEQATNFMRTIAFVTLGACVNSAEKNFYPYLEDSLKVITTTIFKKSTTDIIPIQAAAIQSLGKIVFVFYPESPALYNTYILPSIEHIFNTMQTLEDFEIREAGLCFFYHIASALQQEFTSLIDKVTNFALKIANSEAGVAYESSKDNKEFSLDTDSDEENRTGSAARVNMSFLDEKAAAIHALGEFSQACPVAFAGFIEKALETLEGTIDYFNENIRTQTLISYKDLAESIVKAANGGILPKFKPGFPVETNLNAQAREYLNIISDKLVHSLENDDSAEVITTAIDSLTTLCNSIGPVIIEKTAQDIVENIQKRLKKREKDLKNDEEETEDSLMIFEYISDLIPGLAKAIGPDFEKAWTIISPLILASLGKDRESDEYIQIIGCLGLIFKYVPHLLDAHLLTILSFFEARVPEKDDEVNRNIAFCLGIMSEKRPDLMVPYYEKITVLLKAILKSADFLEARENVFAAFCRMVIVSEKLNADELAKVGTSFDLIHQELVKNIFPFLPFKGDCEEEKTVFKYIAFLFKKDEKSVIDNLEKISEILLDGVIHSKKYNLSDKFLTRVTPLIKNICASNQGLASKIETSVMALNENEKNRVINLLK